MRRVALSRLGIALGCPGSHRDDAPWEKDVPSWSSRGGKGLHSALEVYPREPDFAALAKEHNLTPRHLDIIRNQLATLRPWLERNHRRTWQAERAFAYNPLTETVRDLYGEDRNTFPGEWYGRFDVVDPTPDDGLVLDWKGGKQPVPPPKQNPQVWGGVGIVAQRFGLTRARGTIVQIGENELEESGQAFDAAEIAGARERMRRVQLALVPDAPYIAGPHCQWCPARKTCATRAAAQNAPKQEESPVSNNVNTSNVRPIASARMTLKSVVTGTHRPPLRALLHGPEKLGKSSFCMGAPKPIFIPFDNGLDQLGPARFPRPESFDDLLAALEQLRVEAHDYKTVVIDPVNLAEPFVFAKVCEEYGKTNIDEVLGGFMKGQARALKYWRQMIDALEALRSQKGMHVILTAHTAVRNQKNPEAQDWGSWQPAMDKNGADEIKRWVDAILFGRFEEFAKAVDGKTKGRSTGARVLLTQPNAAYAAGNRYGLPAELPLSWAEFWSAVERGHGKAEEMREQARKLAHEFGPDVVAKCDGYLAAAGADVNQLAEIINALELKKQSA